MSLRVWRSVSPLISAPISTADDDSKNHMSRITSAPGEAEECQQREYRPAYKRKNDLEDSAEADQLEERWYADHQRDCDNSCDDAAEGEDERRAVETDEAAPAIAPTPSTARSVVVRSCSCPSNSSAACGGSK